MLATAMLGRWSARTLSETTSRQLAAVQAEVALSLQFASSVSRELHALERSFDRTDSVSWTQAQALSASAHRTYQRMIRELVHSADVAELVARIDRQLSLAETHFSRARALAELGQPDAALAERARATPAMDRMHADLRGLSVAQGRWIAAASSEVASAIDARTRLLVVAIILAIVLSVFASSRLIASITRPLDRLVAHAEHLSKGEMRTHTDPSQLPGELKVLAAAMNHAAESLAAREGELHAAQRELIQTARHAGMAEVATGVLHNVGNVLTSVNVSATLLAERARGSGASKLTRAARMLVEHPDPAAFITHDERGRQLPQYFVRASEALERDREELVDEAGVLLMNVAHIREIIQRQQTHAVVRRVVEEVQLARLVEDALSIELTALIRLDIDVKREFEDVGPVHTDAHLVMQILLNLVSNAKHALARVNDSARSLTIHISETEQKVCVEVRDTGVGIRPDHMPQLFTHGFTTRDEGHGIGLHTSALAAEQIGAALRAHSDGAGKGATFTLELPRTTAVRSPTPAASPALTRRQLLGAGSEAL